MLLSSMGYFLHDLSFKDSACSGDDHQELEEVFHFRGMPFFLLSCCNVMR